MTDEFNSANQLIKPKELCCDRYVKPSGLSREAAKKIAEAHGVVWGCD